MSFVAPAGLLLLLLLPVLWWLHRRATRRAPTRIPSLLFLREELDAPPARRFRIDSELLLGLAALATLGLAAAGPLVHVRSARRTVTLVTSGGAPAMQRGWEERVRAAEDRVRAVLGEDLDLHTLRVPSVGRVPRPLPTALLATAYAFPGTASLVLSDHASPDEDDVWWTWGRDDAENVGIVSTSVTPERVGLRVFALVARSGSTPTSCALVLDAPPAPPRRTRIDLEGDGFASIEIGAAPAPESFTLRLATLDGGTWADDLAADDAIVFQRRPLRVEVSSALPESLRRAFDAARVAALGDGAAPAEAQTPDLRVVVAGEPILAGPHLVLHPLPPGVVGRRAPPGRDVRSPDALVRDLDSRSADLVFAPSSTALEGEGEVLLARAGRPPLPVVVRRGAAIHFLPDPTSGAPAPASTPLWPLFVENVLRHAGGRVDRAGYRRDGLLDIGSTLLGREEREAPLLGRIASLPPDRAAVAHALRPWLAGLAALLLALLFSRGGIRALRRARRGRR